MTEQEYKYFLNDPVKFFNNPHLYTKIKNNNGSLKLLIDIFDYDDLIRRRPSLINPGADIALSRTAGFKGYLPESIGMKPFLVHNHYWKESLDFVQQDSEAMIIPVYIGYAPIINAPMDGDGKNLQWCLKVSSKEGKIVGHSLRKDEHRTRKENAYYLQWGPDKCYLITLRDKADLFFTDQLSGCGILIFETPHEMIIMHHNRKSWGDPLMSNNEVVKIARSYLAKKNIIKYRYINSNHYNSDLCAGVFGVRANGRWTIYLNRYAQVTDKKGRNINGRVTQRVDLHQKYFLDF